NNMAHVECCDANELHINVSGNGSFSDNRVNVNHGRNGSDTQVFQTNNAAVTNSVNAKAQTGENTANRNTGGNVSVRTGDALTSVEVSTTANANAATIGGEGHGNGSISARIMGNGSRSNNTIDLNLDSSSLIVQENNAVVSNGISSDASTGTNNTNDNTGGDVMIRTGNARAGIVIDNLVNFNAADIDCGCILDLEAKIANNGSESDNQVDMNLGGDIEIFQGEGAGNNALLVNVANSETESGENRANFNTGRPGDDPSIWTGNAWSYTDVSNTGNVNMYGGHMWTFPEFEWEWSFARLFMR
ncbi:MAG: hypothetical protein N3A54_04870, partial [Patescibacteria group bacterium]|nr:hypothetical protein [Patescibacteria group bacterium]